ncbi:SCO family protein [Streptomyces spiroverticillatus]|uniref:SCO family protein n=1 Tax=Streptomyces finlayi TaxID=67296 RepID=A0A918WUL4_9ACTN|nr:SCO family protein [Streptomyces finlayi]GGZ99743.1 SCO family protein [Streptomyces spiroverticillatus]GHC84406.1 SCO family protein [Streptomyces finlayi]
MRKKNVLVAAALVAAATLTLSACGGDSSPKKESGQAATNVTPTEEKAATVLDRPYTKPNLVLKDTNGKEYDFREATKGKPTLIYFGYTNCPDVCPLTMSNIAVAYKKLPKADQEKLRVVFVTTDPERDTPKELGKWLKGAGSPDFIGLTGDFPTIQAGARQLGVSIEPSTKDKDGKVTSMHTKQVIAFSPKTDAGYLLYTDEATADDYTADLPKIVKGETP